MNNFSSTCEQNTNQLLQTNDLLKHIVCNMYEENMKLLIHLNDILDLDESLIDCNLPDICCEE